MGELRVIEGGAAMSIECQRCERQRDDVAPRGDLGMWLCDECEPLVLADRQARPAEREQATPATVAQTHTEKATRTAGSAAAALARELAPAPEAVVRPEATARPRVVALPDPPPERGNAPRGETTTRTGPHLSQLDGDDYLCEPTVRDQMDAVVEALELDASVRAIASHMAKSANRLNRAQPGRSMWESNPTLARHTGYSVDTVKRARKTLVRCGVIVRGGNRYVEGKKMPVYDVGWADVLAAERNVPDE
jgi:hypothetical protein